MPGYAPGTAGRGRRAQCAKSVAPAGPAVGASLLAGVTLLRVVGSTATAAMLAVVVLLAGTALLRVVRIAVTAAVLAVVAVLLGPLPLRVVRGSATAAGLTVVALLAGGALAVVVGGADPRTVVAPLPDLPVLKGGVLAGVPAGGPAGQGGHRHLLQLVRPTPDGALTIACGLPAGDHELPDRGEHPRRSVKPIVVGDEVREGQGRLAVMVEPVDDLRTCHVDHPHCCLSAVVRVPETRNLEQHGELLHVVDCVVRQGVIETPVTLAQGGPVVEGASEPTPWSRGGARGGGACVAPRGWGRIPRERVGPASGPPEASLVRCPGISTGRAALRVGLAPLLATAVAPVAGHRHGGGAPVPLGGLPGGGSLGLGAIGTPGIPSVLPAVVRGWGVPLGGRSPRPDGLQGIAVSPLPPHVLVAADITGPDVAAPVVPDLLRELRGLLEVGVPQPRQVVGPDLLLGEVRVEAVVAKGLGVRVVRLEVVVGAGPPALRVLRRTGRTTASLTAVGAAASLGLAPLLLLARLGGSWLRRPSPTAGAPGGPDLLPLRLGCRCPDAGHWHGGGSLLSRRLGALHLGRRRRSARGCRHRRGHLLGVQLAGLARGGLGVVRPEGNLPAEDGHHRTVQDARDGCRVASGLPVPEGLGKDVRPAAKRRQGIGRDEVELPHERVNVRHVRSVVHLLAKELDEHPALGVGGGGRDGRRGASRGRWVGAGDDRAVGGDVLGDLRHGHWHALLARLLLRTGLLLLGLLSGRGGNPPAMVNGHLLVPDARQ